MADDQPTVTQTVTVPQAGTVAERLAAALGAQYEVRGTRRRPAGSPRSTRCWTCSSTAGSR